MTTRYRYLIVGGGMTAAAACRGIRAHDAAGTIGLVADEPHPPYKRPPLTKGLWKNADEELDLVRVREATVDVRLGRGSSALTSRPAERRMIEVTSMPTSGSCSRPAAERASSPSGEAASSISARSTTTGACAGVRTLVPVSS